VERMLFSSDLSIWSVSIPRGGWRSYIFSCVLLQAYFDITPILYALSITHFDVSRPQGSAAALDGRGALDGSVLSRVNESLKVKISSTSGSGLETVRAKVGIYTRGSNLAI